MDESWGGGSLMRSPFISSFQDRETDREMGREIYNPQIFWRQKIYKIKANFLHQGKVILLQGQIMNNALQTSKV